MRKQSLLISSIVFTIVGVILLFFKQWDAAVMAISFGIIMGLGVLVILFMQHLENKKLDKKYFVRRKEFVVKDYNKLVKEFQRKKYKSLSLTVLKLTKEHDQRTLKLFGRWLKESFMSDPIGYDDGIIILFINIHESLMPEMIKQMRKRLKELRLGISFKSGYAFYTGEEDYEQLRSLAEQQIQ